MKKLSILLITAAILVSCGGGEKAAEAPKLTPEGLTQEQVKKGIGPIKNLSLAAVDTALVTSGKAVFDLKCVACHKVNERLVGPPLAGITTRRSPEFIMNMILNPDEMVKKHPEVKAMLATYYIPMTFQNVTQEDARAILEYFRTL